MTKRSLVLLPILACLCVLVSVGQAPPPSGDRPPGLSGRGDRPPGLSGQAGTPVTTQKVEEAEVVLRISVNLVQVDAVVTDSKGHQVTDLKAQDFTILQDGKPQTITHFSYITAGRTPAPKPPVKPAAPVDKTAPPNPPPPPRVLRPEQIRRTIALVVDDLGLSWESTAQVRAALKKFVDTQIQPDDLVAIVRTSAGMGALQQFTSDRRQLYAALERVRYNMMGRAGIAAFAPISASSEAAGGEPTMGESPEELRERVFSVGTLGAINFIVRGLKTLPGRKSIVLFSDNLRILNRQGFNYQIIDSLRQLTDDCNRAGVVIYSIDPRGLPVLGLTAADNVSGMSNEQVMERMNSRREDHFDSQVGLAYLAEETGGLFITNNNDINWGLDRVLEDQAGYYLIGYTPDRSTFDEKTGRRYFHKISVRIKRPGLHVRSRTGFYGVSDEGTRPVYRTREDQMMAAIASPFGSGAVRLRLTPLFGHDPVKGSFVYSMLHIDGRDVTFTPDDAVPGKTGEEAKGWYKTVLEILTMTFGANGDLMDQSGRTYTIRVRGKEYDAVRQNGLVYTVAHPVKKPGAYQLRVAVRDAATEKVGSASQFIEVPDVKKGRLTLTGIMVRALPPPAAPGKPAAAVSAAPTEGQAHADPDDPMGSPAVRIFRPGRALLYACQVLNAQVDHASKKPQLESQLRLFHNGQQIYTGKSSPVDTASQAVLHRLVTGGELRLARSMEPGEYALQVVVVDKLAKEKNRIATQWIDFEIAR